MDTKQSLLKILSKLGDLKASVGALDERQSNLEQGQSKLEQGISTLEEGQQQIALKLDRLETTVYSFEATNQAQHKLTQQTLNQVFGSISDMKVQYEFNQKTLQSGA